jgi:hypothetical protein
MSFAWLSTLSSIAVCAQSIAGAPSFPWHDGDKAPIVAGVHLGDTQEQITQALGSPAETQKLGEHQLAFMFPLRGVTVAWASLDGAAIILLNTREAGDIGGVRIGDSRDDILSKWGAPSTAGEGTAIYVAGPWCVVLKLDENNLVVQLYLGRVAQ